MRGLFVTGTGTGVGKTVLSAALLAGDVRRGAGARREPVVTGLDEPSETGWPPDHQLLAGAAGMTPRGGCALRYGPAVYAPSGGRARGRAIDPADLLARASEAAIDQSALIVEGVGGLLVPLADEFTVRDFAVALGLPVIAASPGLGTINHTLLSIESAQAAGLDVRAVVLTPWPDAPTEMECSNRDTISRLGEIEVAVLAHVPSPSPRPTSREQAVLSLGSTGAPRVSYPSDA